MGCGSARQTGCMRQLPGKHCRIRQAAEWLFRPTHGVWGARVCWGRGRLRHYGSFTVPLHASNWGSWPGPAHGQQAKAKGAAISPQKPRDTGEEGTRGKGPCTISAPTSEPPSGHTSTWSLLSVHSDILTFNKLFQPLFQTLSWPSPCSIQSMCLSPTALSPSLNVTPSSPAPLMSF